MDTLLAVAGAVIAVLLIILIHEAGHFGMARAVGVRVLRFSIGFGRPICRFVSKKSQTEYVIGWLPLGGYVRMYGDESDPTTKNDPDAYAAQALWKRFLIVVAGPMVNFILAIVIIWGLFLSGVQYVAPVIGAVQASSPAQAAGLAPGDLIVSVGGKRTPGWQQVAMQIIQAVGKKEAVSITIQPKGSGKSIQRKLKLWSVNFNKTRVNALEELGLTPFYPQTKPVIANVLEDSPASRAGFRTADLIMRVNAKPVPSWRDLATLIRANPGSAMRWTIKREGREQTQVIHIGSKAGEQGPYGYAGILVKPPTWPPEMLHVEHYGPLAAWVPAWQRVWGLLVFKMGVLFKLVMGELSMKVMGGPITIFHAAGQATLAGWQVYWQFVAIISLSIGFINLLPVPGLDGGHLLFQLIELIRRRPVSLRVQQVGVAIGMGLLILLMIQVTFYDLTRLFNF